MRFHDAIGQPSHSPPLTPRHLPLPPLNFRLQAGETTSMTDTTESEPRKAPHRHLLRRHRQRNHRKHFQRPQAVPDAAQDREDASEPAGVLRSRRRHAGAAGSVQEIAAGHPAGDRAGVRIRARRQRARRLPVHRREPPRRRRHLSVRLFPRRLHGAGAGGADPQDRADLAAAEQSRRIAASPPTSSFPPITSPPTRRKTRRRNTRASSA